MRAIFAALFATDSNAARLYSRIEPDVFGPEGANYTNNNPDQELDRIGIDIIQEGAGEKCSNGDWTSVKWTGYLKDGRVITDS